MFTVVNARKFQQLLQEANYNPKETEFIFQGFSSGFSIGYEGPRDRQQKARNLPLRCRSKTDLWNKMVKEVNLKQFAGPFKNIPYKYYV